MRLLIILVLLSSCSIFTKNKRSSTETRQESKITENVTVDTHRQDSAVKRLQFDFKHDRVTVELADDSGISTISTPAQYYVDILPGDTVKIVSKQRIKRVTHERNTGAEVTDSTGVTVTVEKKETVKVAEEKSEVKTVDKKTLSPLTVVAFIGFLSLIGFIIIAIRQKLA